MKTKQRKLRPGMILIYLILLMICLLCIIPIFTVISISFSTDQTLIREGYGILPRDFTTAAYEFIFRNPASILRSYGVSILNTGIGCVVGLSFDAMVAYVMSRKNFRFKKQLTIFFLIPMLLSGGMVSQYILISRYLKLKDTVLAMILPLLVTPWYVMLLKTFFSEVPFELCESATIDGAGEFRTFFSIVLPLAKPALATIAVFIMLQYWNDWYYPLMYIENRELYNLQFRLYAMMKDMQELVRDAAMSGLSVNISKLPTESMRMAMCVIAAGPMLLVFPFFQKYFVRGLTVGSVKG